jgi:hypothetical protein
MSKSALLVGINEITNVYDVLVKYFGFASTDIAMLSDKRATKKAILEGLKVLISKGGTGDTLVFHYSGHGSQALWSSCHLAISSSSRQRSALG